MRFRVLGPIEVWDGDHKLPVPAGRQRTLLAYLLVNRDSVVTTDRLVDELWQAAAPPTAGKIVRNLVSELRKLIGDANGVALVSEGRGYRLHVPAEQIDATRFERRATEGRRLLEIATPQPRLASFAKRSISGEVTRSRMSRTSRSSGRRCRSWKS